MITKWIYLKLIGLIFCSLLFLIDFNLQYDCENRKEEVTIMMYQIVEIKMNKQIQSIQSFLNYSIKKKYWIICLLDISQNRVIIK